MNAEVGMRNAEVGMWKWENEVMGFGAKGMGQRADERSQFPEMGCGAVKR